MPEPNPRPESLVELTDAHLSLLERWRGSASQAKRARVFRKRVQAAGRWLVDPAQRDAAQTLIDYWASALAGCGDGSYPEVMRLAPFDERRAGAVAASAQAVVDQFGEDERQVAERLFKALFDLAGDRLTARRTSAGELDAVFAGVEWRPIAERFVAAGILGRTNAGEAVIYELAAPSLVEHWSWLREVLALRRQRLGARFQRLGAAELWLARGQQPAWLLGGPALFAALSAEQEDRALLALTAARGGDEGVAAYSRQQALMEEFLNVGLRRERARRVTLGAAAATFAVLITVIIGGGLLASEDRRELVNERAAFQDELKVVEAASAGRVKDAADETATPVRPLELPALTGCLWIGADQSSRLLDSAGARPASAPSALPGRAYRVVGATYLRATCPDADYRFGEIRGFVGEGRLVVAEEGPIRFDRSSGARYWMRARVTPRVSVHYYGGAEGAVETLTGTLAARGFDVPPVEQLDAARGRAEVRYFRPEDQPAAELLARTLLGAYAARDGGRLSIRCTRLNNNVQVGALEAWLDLSSTRAGSRGAVIPAAPLCRG